MDVLGFAGEMETAGEKFLGDVRSHCSGHLAAIVDMLSVSHREFVILLTQARSASLDKGPFPDIDNVRIVGSEEEWRQATARFLPADPPSGEDMTVLWSLCAILDRSAQFYAQASQNSAQPQTRLFYSSVAELKQILRRKVDGIYRITANQVWAVVGFPPGLLAKE